ncbi:MAG TPA: transcriptional regulator [Clostridiales bacterium]|nr:transcriptional regulator [Clostridiales bacterium]
MQFYEKLDFLMNITNTTNSALSLYINLDSSHISRLRRGKRNAVKDENSLRLMAEFFTRRCSYDYQRKALADILGVEFHSLDATNSSKAVLSWLMDVKKEEAKKVENFLNQISNISARHLTSESANVLTAEASAANTEIYFGLAGKRLAVESFLSEVLARKQSQTLLLYSDEPMDWLTADRKFMEKWAALMLQVLSKGNRIKIIHTVSRDLDEMLHAISQWMPLYLSCLIEPYYYPKKRDGIFKRTLFIASDTAAVTSSTTGDMINKAVIFYTKNKEAVWALTEEFNQYISLCSPLMKIFTPHEKTSYADTLLEFEKERGNCIIITESLSLLTMPEKVSSRVIPRIMDTSLNYIELAKNRMLNFQQQLKDNSFFEIIRIVDGESIKKGEVKIASYDMLGGKEANYTLEEYILHLENIQQLMNTYPNFNVCLTKKPLESRYMVYVKENLGAIIAKTSAPSVVLAFNESNLTAGFWDYLRYLIGEKAYRSPDKKESSGKLREYISTLKQYK